MLKPTEEKQFNELINKYTFYFKWRKNYNSWVNSRIFQEKFQNNTIDQLIQYFPSINSYKILDIGSGMGGFLVAMTLKGYKISGIDINNDYCQITKLRGKKYNLDIDVTQCPAENINIISNSIDLIYCNDVLEHANNPNLILKEMHRLLKNNGFIWITIINRFGFRDPHYHINFINWMPRKIANNLLTLLNKTKSSPLRDKQKLTEMHYFTYNSFKNTANKIGFDVFDTEQDKVISLTNITNKKIKLILKLLSITKLNFLLYVIYRTIITQKFTIILKKK